MAWNISIPGTNIGFGNSSPSGMADAWVNSNYNAGFAGTLAALDALINSQSNDCASSVHSQATGTSTSTAYSLCNSRLQTKYAGQRNQLQGEAQAVQGAVDNATITAANGYASGSGSALSGNTLYLVGAVLVFFILLVIILL